MVITPTEYELTSSPSNRETPAKHASAPFDGSSGDIILRSSDHVCFRVLKSVLVLASSIFADMFTLPQPTTEDGSTAEVPVVQLSESSFTINVVLRLCYPVKRVRLDRLNISLIADVLRAGMKYDIDVVVEAAAEAFENRVKINEEEAVTGYALACSLNRKGEARVAAIACLQWPALGAKIPQLALMSGLDHYNLLDFRQRAGAALASLIRGSKFYKNICPSLIGPCSECPPSVWQKEFKSTLANVLEVIPTDFNKVSTETLSKALEKACPGCSDRAFLHWTDARSKIVKALLKQIDKVELSFSWE